MWLNVPRRLPGSTRHKGISLSQLARTLKHDQTLPLHLSWLLCPSHQAATACRAMAYQEGERAKKIENPTKRGPD